MFSSIDELREPLLAARLLREEILAMPVPPDRRDAVRASLPREKDGVPAAALVLAAELGSAEDLLQVPRALISRLAVACGSGSPRALPGALFHGQDAPPASDVSTLFDEVLVTVNSPRSVEGWSPVLRAFALHFLLRLVQPFEAPPEAVGQAAEALVLASDGFDGRLMGLGGAAADGRGRRKPDPDAFALERAHALVDALGRTRDALRAEVARAVLELWSLRKHASMNIRQRMLVRTLAHTGQAVSFADYRDARTGLGSGIDDVSLRSLQRDWSDLVRRGFLVESSLGEAGGSGFVLSTAPLEWGS